MKEHVVDAFADFLDEYKVLTPLAQSSMKIINELSV